MEAGSYVIGLTGGIAAGKSTVAGLLAGLGAARIDADELAREVVRPGSDVLAAIAACFDGALAPDGSLDRAALGRRVFADPEARRRLEAITHPAIVEAGRRRIAALAASGHRAVVYEAALLCETGRHRDMDRLIVVVADDEVRIHRLMARSGLTRADAEVRLRSQLPQAEKAALADYLIDNSGSLEQTRVQVERVWSRVLADLKIADAGGPE